MPLLQKIKELEQAALILEPNDIQRNHIRREVVEYSEEFLDTVNNLNAYNQEYNPKKIQLTDFSKPHLIQDIIEIVKEEVDTPGLNPASGGHLGYIPGGGIYAASLGDYLADISNNYAGVHFPGPGAVDMENALIQWMANLIDFPKNTVGNLTSGGSIANLIAVVTAREAQKITPDKITKSVIYLTSQAHHSIDKAFRIAGLEHCIIRYVPMDAHYKMDVIALQKLIDEDIAHNLNPFLLAAAAGTTDTGAVDPLEKLSTICTKHNIWLHIDAAYGGFFALTKRGKVKLKGIELADSVVMDPHKGLFLPYGLGTVLIKNKEAMYKAHRYSASYLQDVIEGDSISPAEISPELTKHFRGLRLWLPLKLYGTQPFVACLNEKLLLAEYFYREIQKINGFTISIPAELSVVIYRYVPKNGDSNQFNQLLVNEIHKDGRVFISSTTLNGVFTLRLAILAFRTHLSTINLALKVLKEKSEEINKRNEFV